MNFLLTALTWLGRKLTRSRTSSPHSTTSSQSPRTPSPSLPRPSYDMYQSPMQATMQMAQQAMRQNMQGTEAQMPQTRSSMSSDQMRAAYANWQLQDLERQASFQTTTTVQPNYTVTSSDSSGSWVRFSPSPQADVTVSTAEPGYVWTTTTTSTNPSQEFTWVTPEQLRSEGSAYIPVTMSDVRRRFRDTADPVVVFGDGRSKHLSEVRRELKACVERPWHLSTCKAGHD